MKKISVRAALAASVFSLSMAMLAQPAAGAASSGPGVSKAVGVPLQAAQKLIQSGDYQGALAQVKIAQALPDQSDYDTYEIDSFLASIDLNLKDYAGADIAMEAAADSPYATQLTDPVAKKQLLHSAILLAGQAQHWSKVVAYEPQLETISGNDDVTLAVTAQAYYFLKDNTNASAFAQKSIDAAKAEGKQPQQIVLELQMNAQAKANPDAAEQTLEQMVANYNRPDDWDQLVGISLSARGISTADGLNMYRVLYIQGPMKTGDDYTYMGSIAESERYSVEARNVLQAGVAAGKLTPNAVLSKARPEAAADERIIAQAISAASKSKRGEDGMQVAQDLWGYGRYADVESLATEAKAKGGLKDPGEANVLIGMAQIAQGKYDQGIATLGQVSGSPPRIKTAHLWVLYAKSKQGTAPAH